MANIVLNNWVSEVSLLVLGTMIFALTIILYCVVRPGQCSKTREKETGYWKEEVKWPLFANNIIFYPENQELESN